MADISGVGSPHVQLRSATEQRRFREAEENGPVRVTTLHLRPAPAAEDQRRQRYLRSQRVTWRSDVTDNPEQQVSKCCCVFHKRKLFGETSSDESSSSSSDSESEAHDGNPPDSASASPLPDGSAPTGTVHDGGCCSCEHEGDGSKEEKRARKRRLPKCTKEHCYCDTRFH